MRLSRTFKGEVCSRIPVGVPMKQDRPWVIVSDGQLGSVTPLVPLTHTLPYSHLTRMLGIDASRPTAHTVSYLTHSTTASHCCSCKQSSAILLCSLKSFPSIFPSLHPHVHPETGRPPSFGVLPTTLSFSRVSVSLSATFSRLWAPRGWPHPVERARPVLRKVCLQDQCAECPFYRWSGWGPEKSVS